MKKMSRLLSALMALAMVLALAACTPAASTPTPAPATPAPATPAPGGNDPAPANTSRTAPASPTVLRIACGPLNGYQNTIYNGVADLINKDLPGFYSIMIEASTGSAENARLLMAGEVDVGTMGLDVAKNAYDGTGAFDGMGSGKIRFLYAHPGTGAAVHIIAHPNSDIETIEDLAGKRMAATAGVMQGYLEDTLFAYDMTLDDLGDFKNLSLQDMMTALQDGTIDAFCYGNTFPNTNFTDLATTFGFKLISVGEDAVAKLIEAKPWYHQEIIPAGTYTGVDNDVVTFAQPTVVCCSADLSDEAAYDIVSTVMSHADDLIAMHKNFTGVGVETGTAYNIIPYHSGAARFFAEQGVTVETN